MKIGYRQFHVIFKGTFGNIHAAGFLDILFQLLPDCIIRWPNTSIRLLKKAGLIYPCTQRTYNLNMRGAHYDGRLDLHNCDLFARPNLPNHSNKP